MLKRFSGWRKQSSWSWGQDVAGFIGRPVCWPCGCNQKIMSQWGIYCVPGPEACGCPNTRHCLRRTQKAGCCCSSKREGKTAGGQTSQERGAHSSPPSARKAHYIPLCTFIKKRERKKKRGTDTGSRLFCYTSKTLDLAATLLFPAVFLVFNHGNGQQLVFFMSSHYKDAP